MIIFILTTLPLDFMSLFVDFLETVGSEGCEHSTYQTAPGNIFSLQEQQNDIPAVIEDIYVTKFSVLLGLELSISFSYRNVFGIQYFQFIHRYIRICNRI